MAEKVTGSFYYATINQSNVVASDGTVMDFTIEISCQNEELFKELIEYIENFKKPITKLE